MTTRVLILPLVMAALASGCGHRDQRVAVRIEGATMGTSYHVTVVETGGRSANTAILGPQIEERLEQLNSSLSTWRQDSEISAFNRRVPGPPAPVSKDFALVANRALEYAERTDGAFDPTVLPLIEAWGFASDDPESAVVPTAAVREQAHQEVGYERIRALLPQSSLQKLAPARLDLSAIAKGYGVDAICELIAEAGHRDYLVEIGGEVRCAGTNAQDQPWQVGIDSPQVDRERDGQVHLVVGLIDCALATSGDYRNFRHVAGKRVSHTIDPRTGVPVQNDLASVSVIAHTCLDADALATAVNVLGEQAGLDLIESLPGVEALLILRQPDGSFRERRTPGFEQLIVP